MNERTELRHRLVSAMTAGGLDADEIDEAMKMVDEIIRVETDMALHLQYREWFLR